MKTIKVTVKIDEVDALVAKFLKAMPDDLSQAEAEAGGRGLWAPDACGRVDADAGALVVAVHVHRVLDRGAVRGALTERREGGEAPHVAIVALRHQHGVGAVAVDQPGLLLLEGAGH